MGGGGGGGEIRINQLKNPQKNAMVSFDTDCSSNARLAARFDPTPPATTAPPPFPLFINSCAGDQQMMPLIFGDSSNGSLFKRDIRALRFTAVSKEETDITASPTSQSPQKGHNAFHITRRLYTAGIDSALLWADNDFKLQVPACSALEVAGEYFWDVSEIIR